MWWTTPMWSTLFERSNWIQYGRGSLFSAYFLAVLQYYNILIAAFTFQSTDVSSPHIRCYMDASFLSNHDFSSQIGLPILLYDESGKCHILDYQSRKFRRIARSALFVKPCSSRNVFDTAYKMTIDSRHTHTYERLFDLSMLKNTLQLFEALAISERTKKHRLMFDIFVASES